MKSLFNTLVQFEPAAFLKRIIFRFGQGFINAMLNAASIVIFFKKEPRQKIVIARQERRT